MPSSSHTFRQILENQARTLLGALPDRWGRMDMMSRSALVGVGRVLSEAGLLADDAPVLRNGHNGGLIVGSRRGSLASDLEYAETLLLGPGMASPHLFGYTLPNIALAEAAIQYKLTGPAYVLIDENPFDNAVHEAGQWLSDLPGEKKIMVAGVLDVIPGQHDSEITSKFTLIQQ